MTYKYLTVVMVNGTTPEDNKSEKFPENLPLTSMVSLVYSSYNIIVQSSGGEVEYST